MISNSSIEDEVRDTLRDFLDAEIITHKEYYDSTVPSKLCMLDILYYDFDMNIGQIVYWILGK